MCAARAQMRADVRRCVQTCACADVRVRRCARVWMCARVDVRGRGLSRGSPVGALPLGAEPRPAVVARLASAKEEERPGYLL